MGLRNLDGTTYELGKLRAYDPSNPAYDLFSEWDRQAILMGGSPIIYRKVIFSESQVDPVYQEVRSKMWDPYGVELYATFEPIPSSQAIGIGGIDSISDEIVFDCNYKEFLEKVGLPTPGSVIHSVHLREDWELVQATLAEFKGWQAIRIQLVCKRFQGTATTPEWKAQRQMPAYKIDDEYHVPG